MSAPNVSDGAVPEWAVKATSEVVALVAKWTADDNATNDVYKDALAIIARHCPVGCAANEVGAGEALTFWKEHYERQKARIAELEVELTTIVNRSVETLRGVQAERDDLRNQLAAAESRCIGLRGLLTNEQEALKRCCKDLAATPAPTAPVGDGALVEALKAVLSHAVKYDDRFPWLPPHLEAQIKRALAVPTGSVKEGTKRE